MHVLRYMKNGSITIEHGFRQIYQNLKINYCLLKKIGGVLGLVPQAMLQSVQCQ